MQSPSLLIVSVGPLSLPCLWCISFRLHYCTSSYHHFSPSTTLCSNWDIKPVALLIGQRVENTDGQHLIKGIHFTFAHGSYFPDYNVASLTINYFDFINKKNNYFPDDPFWAAQSTLPIIE
jgi:hypothetical protein